MMYRHSKNRGISDMQSINTYLIPILKPITYQYASNKMVYESCSCENETRTSFQARVLLPAPSPAKCPPFHQDYHDTPKRPLLCHVKAGLIPKCRVWPFLSRASVTRVGLSYLDKIMRGLGLSGNRAFLTRFCYCLGLLCRVSYRVENWRCLMFDIMKYCMLFSIDVSSHLNLC